MDALNVGSESVDQFLARIASLSSKQGREDEERSKRMEEEMLQARKERQARRSGNDQLKQDTEAPVTLLTLCRTCTISESFQDRPYTITTTSCGRYSQLRTSH